MRLHKDWQVIQAKVESLTEESEKTLLCPNLIKLLIAAEDHRYGKHFGVDPFSILRATYRTLILKQREGGSTIAMQLVRVLSGRYERTIFRKCSEIYLAIKLTKTYPIDLIPKLYLLCAYYGWRMNGLVEAGKRLSIEPKQVELDQAAQIIARLKYPEPKNISLKRYERISSRAQYILKRNSQLEKISSYSNFLGQQNGSI